MTNRISIIIPAKNEAGSLRTLLVKILELHSDAEIIVVNDGSIDDTSEVCKVVGVKEIRHPYSKGNGAAIKTGARAAGGEVFVFMDGDGQHKPEDIQRLLSRFDCGYDMVVGNRDSRSQASFGRLAANRIYNSLASWMVGFRICDLTSGFRVVRASKFKEFLYLLPNGFSYPTTTTMAFFRAGYSVCYEEIFAERRVGQSHINLVKDGFRFFLIIFKIGTLYSPLKIFLPISGGFGLLGVLNYAHSYYTVGSFTNMSALMLTASVLVFLIGLVSEQITGLLYSK